MIEITPTWPSGPAPATPRTRRPAPALPAFGLTHAGLCRAGNEDAFLVAPELGVAAVADGVAGSAGGAVASTLAIAAVRDSFQRETTRALLSAARPDHLVDVPLALRDAAREAHRRIRDEAKVTGFDAMATTLSILLFAAGHAFVLSIGDSRVHRLRGGTLEQLTEDHTALQEWLDRHGAPPAAAAEQLGHMITRAVSARQESIRPDIWVEPAQPGDLFLLSTDGLTNVVAEEAIRDILSAASDLEAAARALIDAALAAGGPDNVTAALYRCGTPSGDR